MDYTIRFAKMDDAEKIMRFINKYWRRGHILAQNKELFLWQYGMDERLSIVIGIDSNDNIHGMLGFVPYDTTECKDIALALWKANPSSGFLGVRLLSFLMKEEPHRYVVCPGVNPDTTRKIYEHAGMFVKEMQHWYRLANKEDYSIANVLNKSIPVIVDHPDYYLKKIEMEEFLLDSFDIHSIEYRNDIPYKSTSYLLKRYFYHPVYSYMVYTVSKKGEKAKTLLVLRVQESEGSRVLRLIDCIGDIYGIEYAMPALDSLLLNMNCEYIDLYEGGLDDAALLRMGWLQVRDSGNTIPDYFSPFEQRNITIYYATSEENVILFKGDGDQDRPN